MADTNALNQQFKRYDQVEKAHTYRLAEDESDQFDEDYRIATLDFAPFLHGNAADKARFADVFGSALQEIGFATLVVGCNGRQPPAPAIDECHPKV